MYPFRWKDINIPKIDREGQFKKSLLQKIHQNDRKLWLKHFKNTTRKNNSAFYIERPELFNCLTTCKKLKEGDHDISEGKSFNWDRAYTLVFAEHPDYQIARKKYLTKKDTKVAVLRDTGVGASTQKGTYYHNHRCEHYVLSSLHSSEYCPSRPLSVQEARESCEEIHICLETPTSNGKFIISHLHPEDSTNYTSLAYCQAHQFRRHLINTKKGYKLKSCIKDPRKRDPGAIDYLFPRSLAPPYTNTQEFKLTRSTYRMEQASDTKTDTKPAKKAKKSFGATNRVITRSAAARMQSGITSNQPESITSSPPTSVQANTQAVAVGTTYTETPPSVLERLQRIHGSKTLRNTDFKYQKLSKESSAHAIPEEVESTQEELYIPREVPATLGLDPVIEETPNTPPSEDKTDIETPPTPRKRKYSWLQSAEV
jgi:hypothetical protein